MLQSYFSAIVESDYSEKSIFGKTKVNFLNYILLTLHLSPLLGILPD